MAMWNRSVAAVAGASLVGALLGAEAPAHGQTVINNTPPQAAPAPQPAPQPATVQVQPQAPVVVQQPASPPAVQVNNTRPAGEGGVTYRPHYGLIAGGATVFGVTYLATALGAAIASDVCAADARLGCRTNNWPLYIPVLGPFIQMGYVEGTGANSGRVLLAFDGVLQAGGLAMMATGIAITAIPRKAAPGYAKLQVRPGPAGGMALAGTF